MITELYLTMISSGLRKIHLVTALGWFLSQANPCSINLLIILSIGASIIIELV
jgi:hypothetical protein